MQPWHLAQLATSLFAMGLAAGAISLIAWRIHHAFTNIESGFIMATQEAVNAIVAQVKKGTAEVVAKIAELQAAADAGQPVDLTELAAAAQALDDIVADAPVVEPVEPVAPEVEGDEDEDEDEDDEVDVLTEPVVVEDSAPVE